MGIVGRAGPSRTRLRALDEQRVATVTQRTGRGGTQVYTLDIRVAVRGCEGDTGEWRSDCEWGPVGTGPVRGRRRAGENRDLPKELPAKIRSWEDRTKTLGL